MAPGFVAVVPVQLLLCYPKVLETDGMRIVVWRDNRANPNEHVWAALTDIDVLVLIGVAALVPGPRVNLTRFQVA